MYDEIKPSKKRVRKNCAALKSLIEKEESSMKKRKLRLKPLIAAVAAILLVSTVSLFTVVNAAPQEIKVKFKIAGEEVEGKYYDYVDNNGFRQFYLNVVMPITDMNFAVIYDMDAPRGESVRVITGDTDPEFLENLRLYEEARQKAWETAEKKTTVTEDGVIVEESESFEDPPLEDFGIILKDSELCSVHFSVNSESGYGWTYSQDFDLGGKFMQMGVADGKSSGCGSGAHPNISEPDWENGIITWQEAYHYYVGKDFKIPEAADNTVESGEGQTVGTADIR